MRIDNKISLALAFTTLLVVFAALPACAQDFPRSELFTGFSYSNFNLGPQTLTFAPTSHNYYGLHLSATFNPKRYLRLMVFDFGWQQGNSVFTEGLGNSQLLFGPQFVLRWSRINVFTDTLLGLTYIHVGGCGFATPSCNTGSLPNHVVHDARANLALGFGGGVDLNVKRRLAVRLLQADYIPARLDDQWENNFRISTGIVFRFAYPESR